MFGLGTIVNTVAIIIGGLSGIFVKNGIAKRFQNIIMQAIGLAVLLIGISGALQRILQVSATHQLDRQYLMVMIFSLVGGALLGEWIDIEARLEKIGLWLQQRFSDSGGNFVTGFVTSSLLFCVGAMAIVGSLEDGLTGNTDTLFAKSILDGVMSVIFGATLGVGAIFSAIPVFIYQGGITLLAGFIKPWLSEVLISQISLVGSVLIMGIGLNILEIKKIKVGNLLPAVFLPFLLGWIK